MGQPDQRQHLESLGLELAHQPGGDQRRLPGAGGRVEQDDPLGDHEVEQVGGLPITPVEGVASAEGLRPDVRVANCLRGADLGAHERDSATQWLCSSLMKLSVLPQ